MFRGVNSRSGVCHGRSQSALRRFASQAIMGLRSRRTLAVLVWAVHGPMTAVAQTNEPPASSPWCGGIADADASRKVEAHWRSRWLVVGGHWYSAYVIAPVAKNPFDLKAKAEPVSAPVAGFIWSSGVVCKISAGPQPDETVVRITATVIAFNEKRRWAPPLKNVLLLDVSFGAPAERRSVFDRSPETSVIAPELKQRVPTLAELPKPSKQLKIPCKVAQVWTSTRCAP